MRIRRLDLLRYGHFTDKHIDLPATAPDFHIIYGPNEAGKSTTLAAGEDFLFGIPTRSPHNFLHDYQSMRIGAVLENDGQTLEAQRRKGTKDTLITPKGTPDHAGERLLATFLGGADLAFFTRMFSLDHQRLREGGQAMVDAKDDIGEMLFSASAGILGLSERLKALREEGDALWGPRRAAHRRYYQLEDRQKAAESALRELTVTVSKWQDLKRDYEKAEQEYFTFEEQIADLSIQQRKTIRIRRVFSDVKRLQEVDKGLEELVDASIMPEDAESVLATAERAIAEATAKIEGVTEQLEALQEARASLHVDDALLLRAQDIAQLEEQRIRVRAGKIDLPDLRKSFALKEADLHRLAGSLEWDAADLNALMARIPPRAKVTTIHRLSNEHGELISAVKTAKKAIKEAEDQHAEHVRDRDAKGMRTDLAPLEGVIAALRLRGDIAGEMARTQRAINAAETEILEGLSALRPSVTDPETLLSLAVPPVTTVQSYRDRYRDARIELEDCQARLRDSDGKIERIKQSRERIAQEKRAITEDTLTGLRVRRDHIWGLVHRQYIEGVALSAEEIAVCGEEGQQLSSCYEASVREADLAADRRFETADASAQLSVLASQIAEEEILRNSLAEDVERLESTLDRIDTEWLDLWRTATFTPGSPDDMLVWLQTRSDILESMRRKKDSTIDLESLHGEEQSSLDTLLGALEVLGVDRTTLVGMSLSAAIETASTIFRDLQQANDARARLDTEIHSLSNAITRRGEELAEAEHALKAWKSQWAPAVAELGLPADSDPASLVDLVNTIDEIRSVAANIHNLQRDRIGAIESLMDAFEKNCCDLTTAIAPDLVSSNDPEAASVELNRRLQESIRTKDLLEAKDRDIESLEKKSVQYEESKRDAREAINTLKAAACVDQLDQLRIKIEQSDRRRHLTQELEQISTRLHVAGDGRSQSDLKNECESVDIDQLVIHEEVLSRELSDLHDKRVAAGQKREAARQTFEAIGGDDAAARAEAERQTALAEMKEVAERYTQIRAAERLLQWSIERYRQQKQAPLLTSAGQYFSILTEGAYSDLRLDYDVNDKPYLIGVRTDGSHVGVDGMSTGTADQLYLALRVAAIEDYLSRANPLPFVADDLFINFDNNRASAGIRVLSQLASKTQVLFFTHHWHLVELSRETLGQSVSVIELN